MIISILISTPLAYSSEVWFVHDELPELSSFELFNLDSLLHRNVPSRILANAS